MGRGATALSATGTSAVDFETKPSHGPDGCDFVTSPVAPPRRSSPAPTRGHERPAVDLMTDRPSRRTVPAWASCRGASLAAVGRLPTCLPGSTSARTSRSSPPARRPRRGRRRAVHHHHRDRRGPRVGLVRLPCPRHGVTGGRPALCDAVVEAGHVVGGRLAGHAPGRGRDRRRLRVGGLLRRIHSEPALEDLLDGKGVGCLRGTLRET